MKRRLRGVLAVAAVMMAAVVGERGARGEAAAAMPTPDEAIYKLVDGHARYLMGAPTNPRRSEARRVEVAAGQHPFAAVLSCADSRVPVEVLFDQGFGDIFSVRVAGNVADVSEMASLEYGVEHLHIPALVVLGHTKCGAVSAALSGGELPPHIAHLLELVAPAVEEGRRLAPGASGNDRVTDVVKRNVVLTMGRLLKESPIVREAVEARKLKMVGAVYDLDDGKVRFMGEHPEQGMILAAEAKKPHVTPVRPAAAGGAVATGGHGDAPVPAVAAPAAAHGVTAGIKVEGKAEPIKEAVVPTVAPAKPSPMPVSAASEHGRSVEGASVQH